MVAFLLRYVQGKNVVGHGISGQVVMARQRITGTVHALKHIALDPQEGDNGSSVADVQNEVAILKRVGGSHPNIVALHDHCIDIASKKAVIALSAGDFSLEEFWRRRQGIFPQALTLLLTLGMFSGLSHLHGLGVLHRDLKPSNILVYVSDNGDAGLMLCDFGQARRVGTPSLTPGRQAVVYRCPEMILGEDTAKYSYPIDVWSAGVIFAEMLTGQRCFCEVTEIGVLHAMFRMLGTPSEQDWPGCTSLPGWKATFPQHRPRLLDSRDAAGSPLPPATLDLVQECLRYCPATRITALGAFGHTCFENVRCQGRAAEPPPLKAEAEPRTSMQALAHLAVTAPSSASSGVPQTGGPEGVDTDTCICSGNCGRRHKVACQERRQQGQQLCELCRCAAPSCSKASIYPIKFCLQHFGKIGLCGPFKAMTLTRNITKSMIPIDVAAFLKDSRHANLKTWGLCMLVRVRR